MKRLSLIALVACISSIATFSAKAQTNIQYHYIVGNYFYNDLKEQKTPNNLLTLEHASGDKWGANYIFADFTMGNGNLQSVYTQIHRDTKFWEAPIYIHLEYDGGVARGSSDIFNHSYLGGLSWRYDNDAKATYLSVAMSYRYDQGWNKPHNMSLLGSWSWTSWNRLFTLSGFAVLNTQRVDGVNSGINFLSEPQFWLNINQFVGVPDDFNLSVGSEVKLSYSVVAPDHFYILPTVAAKWTFN